MMTEQQREMRARGLCAALRKGKGDQPCENPEKECKKHCGILSVQSGLVCSNAPCRGRTRCRNHGGQSPVAFNSSAGKDLRYSKHLPKDLLERFEAAMEDSELISMREDLAILTVRIQDLIGRLKTGEHGSIWSDLRHHHQAFLAAMRMGDQELAGKTLSALGNVIENGVSVETAWEELFDSIERKTVVAGREWKRLADLQQLMTMEDTMSLIMAVMGSVKAHVSSAVERSKIAVDISLLLNKKGDYERKQLSNGETND